MKKVRMFLIYLLIHLLSTTLNILCPNLYSLLGLDVFVLC